MLQRNTSQVVVRVVTLVKTTSGVVTCEVLLLCSEDLNDNSWLQPSKIMMTLSYLENLRESKHSHLSQQVLNMGNHMMCIY